MERRSETWDSFWGQLLRIDFFDGQWDKYHRVADARAEWLEATFNLDKERPVLSCACGEGGIELALARRGFNVTGMDLCPTFIHFAREQAAKENLPATFLVADLCGDAPLPEDNGLVCCFDTFGLLSGENEAKLIKKMAGAVARGGTLLVDTLQRGAMNHSRTWWPVRGGFLLLETKWDKASSNLVVEPRFIEDEGGIVELKDPYDKKRGNHSGVQRYVYSEDELTQLVATTGLAPKAFAHQRQGYFMLAARHEWEE
ncbi:class I SAM-dependent methyltransferase [bacterium]|nr:class I SAM-dependent methyltransferase [bacterium]